MPVIGTEKHPILVNSEAQTKVSWDVKDGKVVGHIRNDQVTHHVFLDPNEAVQWGVALIQMAAGAANQQQLKQVAQANPKAAADLNLKAR